MCSLHLIFFHDFRANFWQWNPTTGQLAELKSASFTKPSPGNTIKHIDALIPQQRGQLFYSLVDDVVFKIFHHVFFFFCQMENGYLNVILIYIFEAFIKISIDFLIFSLQTQSSHFLLFLF